jgi:hypothetical protein
MPLTMDKLRCALVVTTITDAKVLDDYFQNLVDYGHLDQVSLFVIADNKTPKAAYTRCRDLSRRGLQVTCPSLEEQEAYLGKLGSIKQMVPYNSDNRRNIGYLMAYESGADFVVSIDDDNYCQPDVDYFVEQAVVVAGKQTLKQVASDDGWFNICDMIQFEPNYRVYPRGYPYSKRHTEAVSHVKEQAGRVHINEGLWTLDPDVDGITWLGAPVSGKAFKGDSLVLAKDTWAPVNTQNTSLHRDVMPSYYFIRMGYPIGGFNVDRYGDIFSGYFSQACAKHLGFFVRFGTPIAQHRRNSHNYLRDATNELACIWVLEDLTSWLREVKLEGRDYFEAYTALALALEDVVEEFKGFIWTDAVRGFFHQMAHCMRRWVETCRRIG